MLFTLILTVTLQSGSHIKTSTTVIDNFSSYTQCMEAGEGYSKTKEIKPPASEQPFVRGFVHAQNKTIQYSCAKKG